MCCQACGSEERLVPFLLLMALLLVQGSALASDQPTDQLTVEQKRNADGSWLRLTQRVDPERDRRHIRVEHSRSATAPFFTLLQRSQSLSDYPQGGGHLEEMDGDGQLDYVERLYCGAGPNCQARIFKLNPAQQTAYQLFEGWFFLFRSVDGHFVTSSRSSCCSWTHQIYRAPAKPRGITEQDLLYDVYLKGPIDGSATPTCRISRPLGEGWEQAKLANPELLALCEGYGNDVVINPEQAEGER